MRINKKFVPNSRIKQKGAYDKNSKYREEDYLELHNLGREINSVIIVLFGITLIICIIIGFIRADSGMYKNYNKQCDIVAGKNPHFFSNAPPVCHVGPDWTTTPIPL